MASFIIHSDNTVTPTGVKEAFVVVEGDKIKEVIYQKPSYYIDIIQAGNNFLMTGIIDPHVHLNDPGRTEWEGFNTGTKAAITGGVTTLVDMPLNSSPVTTTVSAFQQKLDATKNQLHTNCGFWGGVIPGNERDIEPLIEKGVLGFKAFLTHSGIDEFPNVTEEDLRKVMPIIAKAGLPLLVHCELLTGRTETDDLNINSNPYYQYLASRPRKWEYDAIALMIRLCEEFKCPVHIVHLSSADSIEQIQRAKEKGLPLTVETGQHYLFFTSEEIARECEISGKGRTEFKCAPPIREKKNNNLLWQALKEGIIDFVATDHSPATPSLKQIETGDYMKAWGGIASIQLALPVLWTAAKEKGCNVSEISKWLSANPSSLIKKDNSKGKIAAGMDADLVVWDPEKKFTVTEEMIQHKHKVTPYLNKALYGMIDKVFLSGQAVVENGSLTKANSGKIILS